MFVRKSTYLAKVQELHDLQDYCSRLTTEVNTNNQNIHEMADTIRNMDQLIYQMGQCSSWEAMRPFFNCLQTDVSARQRAESDHIASILRHELLSIYAPKKDTHP